ncbi:MAG TPA: succinate dehydrogenase [Rhabdochlamydiaceae bacterium]
MTTLSVPKVPKAFIWRRLHSLMGLWFLLFLMEHLLTNSQAALWLGDNGKGFVQMVNMLHNLPYLQVIEIILLGVPIALHIILGIKYLLTSKSNVTKKDGSQPYLPLKRNYAYTWQRITSWILLIGIIGHVYKFRFLEYPQSVQVGSSTVYLVKVDEDKGLHPLADRLRVALFDQEAIGNEESSQPQWMGALKKQTLQADQVIAVSSDFGAVTLLTVRDTFKNPIYIALYTIFVLAACFHACNGFWTFLISWGWVLKMAAQRAWVTVSVVLMAIMAFLGLAAIWGSYLFHLKM